MDQLFEQRIFNIQQALAIIGASMSAYTAFKLMEHYDVARKSI